MRLYKIVLFSSLVLAGDPIGCIRECVDKDVSCYTACINVLDPAAPNFVPSPSAATPVSPTTINNDSNKQSNDNRSEDTNKDNSSSGSNKDNQPDEAKKNSQPDNTNKSSSPDPKVYNPSNQNTSNTSESKKQKSDSSNSSKSSTLSPTSISTKDSKSNSKNNKNSISGPYTSYSLSHLDSHGSNLKPSYLIASLFILYILSF